VTQHGSQTATTIDKKEITKHTEAIVLHQKAINYHEEAIIGHQKEIRRQMDSGSDQKTGGFLREGKAIGKEYPGSREGGLEKGFQGEHEDEAAGGSGADAFQDAEETEA
jgi:hypothetical protein